MLVVMRPDSSPAAVDAVLRAAGEAGLEAAVFADGEGGIVQLDGGDPAASAERLAGLPGVARVVPARDPAPPVTSNLRIAGIRPLVPPAILAERLPLPAAGAVTVQQTRREVGRILRRED